MKSFSLSVGILMGAVVLLTSCEKELIQENASAAGEQQSMTILTRGTGSDAKISYPVNMYVMNSSGACVKKETLTEGNALSLSLPVATYQVYAVAGAAEWDYDLPTVATARTDYAIALKDGAVHADLMTAGSAFEVSKDGANTLTLDLQRKVMLIQNVTINDVPATVDAVTVGMSPIYTDLLLDGSYAASTETQTLQLTKQSDGTTWKNATEQYALPAQGTPKLTIRMTTGSDSKTYSYTSPTPLQANSKVSITGSYTENQGLEISGTVNGAEWGDPTDITFNFDDSNIETGGGSGDDTQDGTAPSAETWYRNCYVLTTADDGDYTVVTLMHKDAQAIDCSSMTAAQIETAVAAALPSFDMDGITGWRLPTKAEAGAVDGAARVNFNKGVESAGGTVFNSADSYLGKDDDGGFFGFTISQISTSYTGAEFIRPVTTLRFRK